MTLDRKIDIAEIVANIEGISNGSIESYLVLQGKDAITTMEILSHAFESLKHAKSLPLDDTSKGFLTNNFNNVSKLLASMQKQLVINAQFKEKQAIA